MHQQLSLFDSPSLREAALAYVPPITALPTDEQPLSRIQHAGPAALTTVELLALVMSTTYLMEAQRLLVTFTDLPGIAHASLRQLTTLDGVGPATAARIHASLELGRRLLSHRDHRDQVRSPADAANMLLPEMSLLEREQLRTILLDTKNYVLGIPTIYQGSLNTNLIRIAELFHPAITNYAAAIIVAHNHPSGDPTPSPEDVMVTSKIVQAGQDLDIDVLDHLIIGQGRFVSLKERGLGFN